MGEKNKRSFGEKGENIALEYLDKNGYRIITRNYRVGRVGEIDIIAREKQYVCFIEVKTRSSLRYGSPAESVTASKQRNIRKLAQFYIHKNNLYDQDIRFDVVEILIEKGNPSGNISINLIKNAF